MGRVPYPDAGDAWRRNRPGSASAMSGSFPLRHGAHDDAATLPLATLGERLSDG